MLAAALLAGLLASPAPESFPKGEVVEKVAVAKSPGQSYALYLPSAYSADRFWPVLYLLDARGDALVPLERFRAAAERFGWILVSSYNSRSDTKDDPNSPAFLAMWNDAVTRFPIDGRRVYATGFSGGGRAAVALAYALPGRIAGVVGAGAGFPEPSASVKPGSFAYFGTVGDHDMNYYEMRSLEEKLEAAKVPHRIAYFSGGHEWMPAELAGESVAWMELQAMKSGTRPKDPELVASLQASARSLAADLESAAKLVDAWRAYAQAAEDFRGLADVAEDERHAEELGRRSEVKTALKEAKRRDSRDEATLRSVNTKLRNALQQPDPPQPTLLAAELGIPALRKAAASAETPEERLSADRILANLRAQTGFYLPEEMLDRHDPTRARALLLVRAEIDPDNPLVYYNVAAYAARAGDAARAVKDLDVAVARGFRRFELIDADSDFDPIRQDEGFRRWMTANRP